MKWEKMISNVASRVFGRSVSKVAPIEEPTVKLTSTINTVPTNTILRVSPGDELLQINKTGEGTIYVVAKKGMVGLFANESVATLKDSVSDSHKKTGWQRIEDFNSKSETLTKLGKNAAVLGGAVATGATLAIVHTNSTPEQSCPTLNRWGLRTTKSENDLLKKSDSFSSKRSSFDSNEEID
jgi:hypothetical protein